MNFYWAEGAMRHIGNKASGGKKRWIPILAGVFVVLLIAGAAVYEFAVPAAALKKASRLAVSSSSRSMTIETALSIVLT